MLKKQLNTLLSTALLCLLFVTSATSNAAGFHYQLNLTARLATTPTGELSGVEMSWIYDTELSATLMDGEDLSEANREATLKKRAADILDGLLEMKYFTTLYLDGQVQPTVAVEKYNLQLTQEKQLQLNLTLPLAEVQMLKGHLLQVVVSDPTAVGLATFLTADRLILSDEQKAMCVAPTLEQKQLGDVDGGHTLMSETMTIDCR